jgi:hypothetical protein
MPTERDAERRTGRSHAERMGVNLSSVRSEMSVEQGKKITFLSSVRSDMSPRWGLKEKKGDTLFFYQHAAAPQLKPSYISSTLEKL